MRSAQSYSHSLWITFEGEKARAFTHLFAVEAGVQLVCWRHDQVI